MQGWAVVLNEPSSIGGGVWASAEEVEKTYAVPSAYRAYLDQLPIFCTRRNFEPGLGV